MKEIRVKGTKEKEDFESLLYTPLPPYFFETRHNNVGVSVPGLFSTESVPEGTYLLVIIL